MRISEAMARVEASLSLLSSSELPAEVSDPRFGPKLPTPDQVRGL